MLSISRRWVHCLTLTNTPICSLPALVKTAQSPPPPTTTDRRSFYYSKKVNYSPTWLMRPDKSEWKQHQANEARRVLSHCWLHNEGNEPGWLQCKRFLEVLNSQQLSFKNLSTLEVVFNPGWGGCLKCGSWHDSQNTRSSSLFFPHMDLISELSTVIIYNLQQSSG